MQRTFLVFIRIYFEKERPPAALRGGSGGPPRGPLRGAHLAYGSWCGAAPRPPACKNCKRSPTFRFASVLLGFVGTEPSRTMLDFFARTEPNRRMILQQETGRNRSVGLRQLCKEKEPIRETAVRFRTATNSCVFCDQDFCL